MPDKRIKDWIRIKCPFEECQNVFTLKMKELNYDFTVRTLIVTCPKCNMSQNKHRIIVEKFHPFLLEECRQAS